MKRLFIDERLVMGVIFLNTTALFMHEFYDGGAAWFWIDYGCVVYFLIESAIKSHHFLRHKSWISSWDPIDIGIVILSIPLLFTPFIDLPDFGWVLFFRLGRLFRLFRLIRFIPDGNHLIKGVIRSLKASVGVFLALCLLNLILGLTAAFIFRETAPDHFGNPALAFYSMFKVFTVEGWYEIPEYLAGLEIYSHPAWQAFIRLFFAGAVLFGGILGLSLANAVFVDEMVMDNNDQLERQVADLTHEILQLKQMIHDLHGQAGPR